MFATGHTFENVSVASGGVGTVLRAANGLSFTYTPPATLTAQTTVTINYSVRNTTTGLTSTNRTVTVTVNPVVSQTPTARDTTVNMTIGQTLTIPSNAGFINAWINPITPAPGNGRLSLHSVDLAGLGAGGITVGSTLNSTANRGFSITVPATFTLGNSATVTRTFTYRIHDNSTNNLTCPTGDRISAPRTITINITGANIVPTGLGDRIIVQRNALGAIPAVTRTWDNRERIRLGASTTGNHSADRVETVTGAQRGTFNFLTGPADGRFSYVHTGLNTGLAQHEDRVVYRSFITNQNNAASANDSVRIFVNWHNLHAPILVRRDDVLAIPTTSAQSFTVVRQGTVVNVDDRDADPGTRLLLDRRTSVAPTVRVGSAANSAIVAGASATILDNTRIGL
jgi:hypothetical protein